MRTRLLVFGYPLLEVVTAYAVAQWIGWGWMLLLILAGIPIGFAVMRSASEAAFRDVASGAAGGLTTDPGRHAVVFAAGLLICIPGFWSDLVGLLLLLPPTQRLLRRHGRTWLEARMTLVRMPGLRYPPGDVIPGVVIRPDERPTSDGPSGPPRHLEP